VNAGLCPVCGSDLVTWERCTACHTEASAFPWPRDIPPDSEELEYDVANLEPIRRAALTDALRDAAIAYRWEPGPLLVVGAADETRVDETLEDAGSTDDGDVALEPDGDDGDTADDEAAMDALSRLHDVADRLARRPDNEHAAQDFVASADAVRTHTAPWGFDAATWQGILDAASALETVLVELAPVGDVVEGAERLRDLVRDHV
jgi:hypothetical protein